MKKRRMVQNVESKIGKKNIYKYFWFFITTKWLHWYYYILTDHHCSKKHDVHHTIHSTFCHSTFCPIRHYFYWHFVPFDIISIRHFVPFDIMSHSAFITFDIMSLRRFVPFDILSFRHFVSFDILLFVILSHSSFCRSTFCTFGVCDFDILSVNPTSWASQPYYSQPTKMCRPSLNSKTKPVWHQQHNVYLLQLVITHTQQ